MKEKTKKIIWIKNEFLVTKKYYFERILIFALIAHQSRPKIT